MAVTPDQLWTPGQVGVDALEGTVIKGNDICIDGFDEPEPLQLSKFLGIRLSQVVGLCPVVGPDRYTRYCADKGIPARDLTSWDA